jgi:hypothetical protein
MRYLSGGSFLSAKVLPVAVDENEFASPKLW